jgi:hypothetical protein
MSSPVPLADRWRLFGLRCLPPGLKRIPKNKKVPGSGNMIAPDARRLRLGLALPVLLVAAACAVAAISGGGAGRGRSELLSAIDEYLDDKYGTGDSQALGQLNSMDETGYAGTQSVAKEFGLSDNNPLVRKWDQDNTMDSLDESPMLDPQGHSVHMRAAAIVSNVFGEPPAPAPQVLAGGAVDEREAKMMAKGAKAVQSATMAAQRKEMQKEMLQKFEAQAEATTQKVAAQTPDIIGDGTVPSDNAYLPLPAAVAAGAKKAAVAAAAAAVKPVAAAAPVATAATGKATGTAAAPTVAAAKGKVTGAAKPKEAAVKAFWHLGSKAAAAAAAHSAAAKQTKKGAPAQAAAQTTQAAAKPAAHPKPVAAAKGNDKAKASADTARLEAEIKKLQLEVRDKSKPLQHSAPKAKPKPAPPASWSGLANMLDSTNAGEEEAEKAQQRMLAAEDTDADVSGDGSSGDSKLANYLSGQLIVSCYTYWPSGQRVV